MRRRARRALIRALATWAPASIAARAGAGSGRASGCAPRVHLGQQRRIISLEQFRDRARTGRTPGRRARGARAARPAPHASAARKSSRLPRPTASTAASASITFAGPSGSPASRSTRTKCRRSRRAARPASTAPDGQAAHSGAAALRSATSFAATSRRRRAEIVLVLEQHAQRVGHRLRDRARRGRAPSAPRPNRASRRCRAP